jgi:hypothetical protein
VKSKRLDLLTDPHEQAKRHAAVFVHEEDGANHLLIVYYAGHGNVGLFGQLLLSGTPQEGRQPEDRLSNVRLPEDVDWSEVEIVLSKAKADLLVILDCCHAGVLFFPSMMSRYDARRKFQYIAACKFEQRTRSAGPGSFTSAVDSALKDLAKEPRFTTHQLVCSLSGCREFSCETKEPFPFSGKFGLVMEDIWIAPATPASQVLDLRFHFAPDVSESEIEATADHLQTFLRSKQNLHFHKISNLGHKRYIAEPGTEDGRKLAEDSGSDGPTRCQNTGLLHLVSRSLRSLKPGTCMA